EFHPVETSSDAPPAARSFIRLKLHPTPHLRPEFHPVETFSQHRTLGQSFIRLKLHPTPHLRPEFHPVETCEQRHAIRALKAVLASSTTNFLS
ncbi:MAG: hypothetical protein KH305_08120, partial [Sutterella wadsworthensis]|nr:hypothetical protein [Sutterella wadsworthensis]